MLFISVLSLFGAGVANAQQVAPFQKIECEKSPVRVFDGEVCRLREMSALTHGNSPTQMVEYYNIRGAKNGYEYNIILQRPESSSVYIGAIQPDSYTKVIRNFDKKTKNATNWGDVVQEGDDMRVRFKSDDRECLGFMNYLSGYRTMYEASVTGYFCSIDNGTSKALDSPSIFFSKIKVADR
jgi:hypothetical protein